MSAADQPPAISMRAKPFLKWAGGKRGLLPQYEPFIPPPARVNKYFEPFIGSAAMFFRLQLRQSTLSDRNEKLVELYRAVRDEVQAVIDALKPHRNEADYFYDIRAQDTGKLTTAERAARLIYLNRTCYNGLYRENSRGEFNVPFGRYKNPTICNEGRLRSAAEALKNACLVAGDFADIVATAERRDLVYFDPPYVPLNLTSSFTSYDRMGFNEDDQRRLAEEVRRLTRKGCLVMLSNSSAELVYELYQDQGYRLIPIQARRSINSQASKRGAVNELLILNYDSEWKAAPG